jgi:hypothetical protein
LSKISSQIAYSRTLRAAEDADGNKGRCIELRHFFVTPGVAAAHALSGFAIFAGAESVLKTTPLFILGLMVPLQLIVLLTCSWHTGSCGATSHFSKMKSPGLGRPGQRTEEPRGVGGGMPFRSQTSKLSAASPLALPRSTATGHRTLPAGRRRDPRLRDARIH